MGCNLLNHHLPVCVCEGKRGRRGRKVRGRWRGCQEGGGKGDGEGGGNRDGEGGGEGGMEREK